MPAAERLVQAEAPLEDVIALLGPPLIQATNNSGQVVLHYILSSGMEEKWNGTICGGVSILIENGKVKGANPILE